MTVAAPPSSAPTSDKAIMSARSVPGMLTDDGVANGSSARSLPPLATLKCALCCDYLKQPVTLPCLHTGCHDCFLKQAGPFSPIPEGSKKKPPPCNVTCSVCKEEAAISRDPTTIFTDSRVVRLIGLIQESRHLCDNCGEIAEVACTVCTSSMCSGCYKSTHSAPVFAKHEAKPLEMAKLAQLSNCGDHGSEMEFWCDTCSKGVCQVCLLKGDHKGHKYTPIRDVRNAAYMSIKEAMKSAVAFKAQMKTSKAKVAAAVSTLSEQHSQVCKEIEENFDKIEAAIKDRRTALLRDASDLRISKEKALNAQMEELEDAISNVSDAIERSSGLINYSNDLEIVERQSLVEERLKKMTLSGQSWEPRESGTLSVALFGHINAAVAGYGSVRGTPVAAATAHKHQLEKLVGEADKILSNRAKIQAADGSALPVDVVATSDGSYCSIM